MLIVNLHKSNIIELLRSQLNILTYYEIIIMKLMITCQQSLILYGQSHGHKKPFPMAT